ncbi:MAG: 3-oxoacyl-ACP synthase III [Puniceicoccales bacterium]|jgi:3-oxoacyl-[acyl-carrier-protein] synthase-3|nr:3-oxoacyl-ACP synthase III [Puniceicoccales bacterium]
MFFSFENVSIEAMAYVLPPESLSSDSIETRLHSTYERLGLSNGRLKLMTGIKERRFWNCYKKPSEASAEAADKLFASGTSCFKKNDLDLLIHSSVCRDRLEPSTAAYVHNILGLGNHTQFFDLSNACLGFINSILIAGGMIESGKIKCALIVSGEDGKPVLDNTIDILNSSRFDRNEIKPYFANLTLGSGAVAALLCHSSFSPKSPKIKYANLLTDSSVCKLCEGGVSDNSLTMQTESEKLLNAGVALASLNWQKFCKSSGWNEKIIDKFLCHQVSRRHMLRLYETLNLDPTKDFSTYQYLGNTGSVALPITFAIGLAIGGVKSSSKCALLGIGSGLSSIILGIQL